MRALAPVDRIPRTFSVRVGVGRDELVRTLAAHPRCREARELRPFPPPPTGAPVLLTYGESELRLRHYVSPWEIGVVSPRLVIRLVREGDVMTLRGRFEVPAGHAPRVAQGVALLVGAVAFATAQWPLLLASTALFGLAWSTRRFPVWADATARARLRVLWNVASDSLFQHALAPAAAPGAPYRSPG